jgi:hypothetical protein
MRSLEYIAILLNLFPNHIVGGEYFIDGIAASEKFSYFHP